MTLDPTDPHAAFPPPPSREPDEQALRGNLSEQGVAAAQARQPLARLGVLYARTLSVFLRSGWIYLVCLGYIAIAGVVYGIGWFVATFTALLAVAIFPDPTTAAYVFCAYILLALIVLGLLISGYNGGLIRMLSPLPVGGRPDFSRFVGGVFGLGPRLFLVYLIAMALSAIPVWMLLQYAFTTISEYGWATITSGWNRELQLEILATVARYALTIVITMQAINLLLGPWQAVVGTRRINLIAALPVTLAILLKKLPVTIVVLAVNFGIALGVGTLGQYSSDFALLINFVLSPLIWASLVLLVADVILPEQPVAPPQALAPRPPPLPAQEWRNPVPGLMPEEKSETPGHYQPLQL